MKIILMSEEKVIQHSESKFLLRVIKEQIIRSIQNRIYEIPISVLCSILYLADLYEVSTKGLNHLQ